MFQWNRVIWIQRSFSWDVSPHPRSRWPWWPVVFWVRCLAREGAECGASPDFDSETSAPFSTNLSTALTTTFQWFLMQSHQFWLRKDLKWVRFTRLSDDLWVSHRTSPRGVLHHREPLLRTKVPEAVRIAKGLSNMWGKGPYSRNLGIRIRSYGTKY